MNKKLLLALVFTTTVSFAATPPKMGCILAQQGEVLLDWTKENGQLKPIEGVLYNPIKVEGSNFRKIIVGSKIQWKTKDDKNIIVKFTDIKADKRVKGQARTGNIKGEFLIGEQKKNLNFQYSFANDLMEAKSSVDYLQYKALNFKMKIKAILCAVPKKEK